MSEEEEMVEEEEDKARIRTCLSDRRFELFLGGVQAFAPSFQLIRKSVQAPPSPRTFPEEDSPSHTATQQLGSPGAFNLLTFPPPLSEIEEKKNSLLALSPNAFMSDTPSPSYSHSAAGIPRTTACTATRVPVVLG